jgi:hypothetical protein
MTRQVPILDDSTRQLAAALRAQLTRWEARKPVHDQLPISSGCKALDDLLPSGGLVRGSLVECLEYGQGSGGAGTLALIFARQAGLEGGALVVLDHRQWFYPPAAAVLGVDVEQLLVIRVSQQRDQLWALDQCLRCPAVAAVWAPWEDLEEHDFRRLQLAAESGGGLGLLVRSHRFRQQPSWSDLQLLVHPVAAKRQDFRRGRQIRVEIVRCRHGRSGRMVDLEIDDVTGALQQVVTQHETHTLHPVTKLAYPASGDRSA